MIDLKKQLPVLLAILLVVSLTACSAQSLKLTRLPEATETPVQASEPADEPTPSTPEPRQESAQPATPQTGSGIVELGNHVVVNVTNNLEVFTAPDGSDQTILNFAYENARVYVEGRDAASEAINAALVVGDELYYSGENGHSGMNGLLETATDNYARAKDTGEDLALEFSSSRSVTVSRSDDRVLSLVYSVRGFDGGISALTYDRAFTFDTESGRQLTLDDLSSDPQRLRGFLVETLKQQAQANADAITLADDVNAQLSALLREGNWSLSAAGMDIFSDAGEIETASGGILHFIISYDALAEVLDSRWLPVRRGGSGAVELLQQEDVAAGSVEYFDRLSVDDDGQHLCLMVDGVVYDLELWRVEYAGSFYPSHLVWHGSYLQNAALQLDALIPDGIPTLMVRYSDAEGNTVSRLISQSGEDGRLLLLDPQGFETVG